jgi:DNA-binding HxlR family transcriptional regulator
MAIKAFFKLQEEVRHSTSRENIDRIISASISVVDGISTALPLIGAAILLISIKLGPEIFLGFSVPFEIKALIILAIGKLFEPVFDLMGVKFQNIVNKSSDLKEGFYHKMQIEQTNKLLEYFHDKKNVSGLNPNDLSEEKLSRQLDQLKELNELSKQTYKYYGATYQVLEKMNSLTNPNREIMDLFKELSQTINQMSQNLNNENVIKSLKSLESIVVRK